MLSRLLTLFLIVALARGCQQQKVSLSPIDPSYYNARISLHNIGCAAGSVSTTNFTSRLPPDAAGTPFLIHQNCGTLVAGRLDFAPNQTMVAGADGTFTVLVVINGTFCLNHTKTQECNTKEECGASDGSSLFGFISVGPTYHSNGCARGTGGALTPIHLRRQVAFVRAFVIQSTDLYVRFCLQSCRCPVSVLWGPDSQVTVYYNVAPSPLRDSVVGVAF